MDGHPYQCHKDICIEEHVQEAYRKNILNNTDFEFPQEDPKISQLLRQDNSQFLTLGGPVSRNELLYFIAWFDKVIEMHVTNELTFNEQANRLKMILTLAGRELVRQLGVTCIERGIALEKLIKQMYRLVHLEKAYAHQHIHERVLQFKKKTDELTKKIVDGGIQLRDKEND